MTLLERHLHRLRQKPDHVKKHIAFWTSLSITLVIVVFWIASIDVGTRSESAVASATPSPWSAMSASVGDAWSSLISSLGASSATYQSPVIVTPGK